MKITLIIGLSGCGKSTYAKTHLTETSLAYDMDAIASAFRLRQPHEEYHGPARRMANDLFASFVESAADYTDDLLIIRTAPTLRELEAIWPDALVWCRRRYVARPMDSEDRALERIVQAVEWCKQNEIPIIFPL